MCLFPSLVLMFYVFVRLLTQLYLFHIDGPLIFFLVRYMSCQCLLDCCNIQGQSHLGRLVKFLLSPFIPVIYFWTDFEFCPRDFFHWRMYCNFFCRVFFFHFFMNFFFKFVAFRRFGSRLLLFCILCFLKMVFLQFPHVLPGFCICWRFLLWWNDSKICSISCLCCL